MKYLFLLFFFHIPMSWSQTEAHFEYDTRNKLDFCCDRFQKSDSAHDLSDQESQKRVQQVLYSFKKQDLFQPKIHKGQR